MGELETETLFELIFLLILITPPNANKLKMKPRIPQMSAMFDKVISILMMFKFL